MKEMHNAEGSSFKFQAVPCSKFEPNVERKKQSDAAEACRAHNPEVGGSKPSSAILPWLFPSVVKFAQFLSLHLSFCAVLSLNLDAP